MLNRILNSIRTLCNVEVLSGSTTEEILLGRLSERSVSPLVLAPWHHYLAWNRIEAFYGLTRTSGPTFAGYFCEPLLPSELGEDTDHLRAILLDLSRPNTGEILSIIRALVVEQHRSGVLPLLEPGTHLYCETWYAGQGLGSRMDSVMATPDICHTEWARRSSAIRICLAALWSLIYEEGPGKSDFQQAITAGSPKAYFQFGADRRRLVFRLCYSLPAWGPKELLSAFWPGRGKPSSGPQLLLRYADFLRAHRITDTTDIEVVVALHSSAPSEHSPDHIRTLWIEPLSAKLVTEIPFENPGPAFPHLRSLPLTLPADGKIGAPTASGPNSHPASPPAATGRERFILDAATKISDLKRALAEREALIRELRLGGVGTAPPLPLPDGDSLLEAFRERLSEAQSRIRAFAEQVAEMEKNGATPAEIHTLKARMTELAAQQQNWIRKLAVALESLRGQKTGTEGG